MLKISGNENFWKGFRTRRCGSQSLSPALVTLTCGIREISSGTGFDVSHNLLGIGELALRVPCESEISRNTIERFMRTGLRLIIRALGQADFTDLVECSTVSVATMRRRTLRSCR